MAAATKKRKKKGVKAVRAGAEHEASRAPGTSAEAQKARERILDSAEREFARRGFDGARVDEIAKAAGVNKALIYYYFKSKEALLDELVDRVLRQIVEEKVAVLGSSYVNDIATHPGLSALAQQSIEITKKRMPIFGILCVEAFKSEEKVPALFRVMDRYMASILPLFERAGFAPRTVDELRLPGFFWGLAPLFVFYLLQEKWADYYKVDGKALEEEFLRYFMQIYGDAIRPFLVKAPRSADTATRGAE